MSPPPAAAPAITGCGAGASLGGKGAWGVTAAVRMVGSNAGDVCLRMIAFLFGVSKCFSPLAAC